MLKNSYNILIINGPNLGYIGVREPEIYGTKSMEDLEGELKKYLKQEIVDKIKLSFFQSNHEGEIIDRMEKAWIEKVDGIVINAGAYTHTSLAIRDCIPWIKIPCVEVHLSNVWGREESIRHKSIISAKCIGVVSGFGIFSYVMGILALIEYLEENRY